MSTVPQTSFYLGNLFNAILYGIEIMFYYSTMRVLLQRSRKSSRSDYFFIFFSTALLVLSAINLATDTAYGEATWILNPNYPGGSGAYFNEMTSVWYETFGTAASICLNWLADGLMTYRCFVVWNKSYVAVFPFVLWISCLGLGFASICLTAIPNSEYFSGGLASRVVLSYNTLTVTNNVVNTSLICGRLLYHARYLRRELGDDAPRIYANGASVIIESALPYTVFGVIFLATYGANNDLSSLFLAFFAPLTAISPQMIIMRVVTGRAWTEHTSSMTSMQFQHATSTVSRPADVIAMSDGATVAAAEHIASKAEDADLHVKEIALV